MMTGRSGFGHRPAPERSAAARIPGGRFSQTGSLERAVRGGALRDELPPVTCRPIHTSWLCECGPRIRLTRKEWRQNQPLAGGPPIVARRRATLACGGRQASPQEIVIRNRAPVSGGIG